MLFVKVWGFVWGGPSAHYWQNFMERMTNGRKDMPTLLMKVRCLELSRQPAAAQHQVGALLASLSNSCWPTACCHLLRLRTHILDAGRLPTRDDSSVIGSYPIVGMYDYVPGADLELERKLFGIAAVRSQARGRKLSGMF